MNRVWIELFSESIGKNGAKIKKASGKSIYAVVKNDGYGMGCKNVARALRGIADGFCIGEVAEGIALREAGFSENILILGYTSPRLEGLVREYGLTQAVFSADYANALIRQGGGKIRVAICCNSGMNRLGFDSFEDLLPFATSPRFSLQSVFTHFASGDIRGKRGRDMVFYQYERFMNVVRRLKRECSFQVHCQNTATALNYPGLEGDFIRCGIGLFGVEASFLPIGLEEVFSLCAKVADCRILKKGEHLSYGVYRASPLPTVTVACGYGDGYPYALTDKGAVKIGERIYKVKGKVCMNMLCAQGNALPAPLEKAVLFGKGGAQSLQDVAHLSRISPYRILCGFSRLEKIIID